MSLVTKPLDYKTYHLKNRLVLASCGTKQADLEGKVTEDSLSWFRRKCLGFGMVILEHSYVSEWGKASPHMLSISRDSDIDGLSKLAELMHEKGCNVQIQLDHGGGWSVPELQTCLDLKKNPSQRRVTDTIKDEELDSIVEDFAKAAVRAKKSGFDGVQIKACHVYLLAQFFSPLTNKRTEGKYAGTSFEGRFNLIYQVARAVRETVGEDFQVSVRLPLSDYAEGGLTIEDAIKAAKILEDYVDMLDMSGGVKYRFMHPEKKQPGYFSDDSKIIKDHVKLPVIVTGGITDIDQAETILEEGKADLIGVCRAVLKNEAWCMEQLSGRRHI